MESFKRYIEFIKHPLESVFVFCLGCLICFPVSGMIFMMTQSYLGISIPENMVGFESQNTNTLMQRVNALCKDITLLFYYYSYWIRNFPNVSIETEKYLIIRLVIATLIPWFLYIKLLLRRKLYKNKVNLKKHSKNSDKFVSMEEDAKNLNYESYKEVESNKSEIYALRSGETSPYKTANTNHLKSNIMKTDNISNAILHAQLIDAVIDLRDNDEKVGKVRAILTKDIYSNDGRALLLMKGIIFIGMLDSLMNEGKVVWYVIWNKLIYPDGRDLISDIQVASDHTQLTDLHGIRNGNEITSLNDSFCQSFNPQTAPLVSYLLPEEVNRLNRPVNSNLIGTGDAIVDVISQNNSVINMESYSGNRPSVDLNSSSNRIFGPKKSLEALKNSEDMRITIIMQSDIFLGNVDKEMRVR